MKTVQCIEMFIATKRARGLSERTIEFYSSNLHRFAQVHPELPGDAFMIESFIGAIPGTQETRHAYYRCLRALYNYLLKRHLIETNPMILVEAPRLPRKVMPTLESLDINLVLIFLVTKSVRDRALITLLLDTGIRSGEAVNLRVSDVHDGYVLVTGKTGQRKVPISEATQQSLDNLIDMFDSSSYVFMGQHGRLTRSGVYRIVRQAMRQIGANGHKLGAHRLRHSFGRHYLVNGGDVRSLQLILGHSNITTTEKYASLADSEVAEKHRQFSPLRRVYA